MALIHRFTRLFRADLHAVLDRIEEPVVLLRQAVREMEEQLTQDERQLKLLQNELLQLPEEMVRVDEALRELQEEIRLCLHNENEKLARSVIRRKLETQFRQQRLEQKQNTVEQAVEVLQTRLSTNRSRLAAMQQKLEILQEEEVHADTANDIAHDSRLSISDDDIEVALLKEKQQHGKQPGRSA